VLEELFAKANRLTLMWAFPFGAGLALFGADLVRFVLGDAWEGAIVLLGGLAVAGALQQVGYNWFSFYRARGESWPQAVESAVLAVSFAAFAVPGALLGGDRWFIAGRLACTGCVLACRRVYVRRLLPGVAMTAIALRAVVPVALATAPVLAVRLALWGDRRTLVQAVLELALWLGGLLLATRRLEGGLIAELGGYLRPGRVAS
jgi:O-antigen/teichoic acid export membrane protein